MVRLTEPPVAKVAIELVLLVEDKDRLAIDRRGGLRVDAVERSARAADGDRRELARLASLVHLWAGRRVG